MWCDGAREPRGPHVTIGQTVSKSETTKNLPAFQDLNGKSFKILIFKANNVLIYPLDASEKINGAVRRSKPKKQTKVSIFFLLLI